MARLLIRLPLQVILAVLVLELIFGDWLGANYGPLNVPRDTDRLWDVSALYPGAPDGLARWRTDHHGLRGDYGGDPARLDLLITGNGTALEQYVGEGQTWADVLRRDLAGTPTPPRIAVAGMNGQTTKGLADRFDTWYPLIPGLKARYVLAYIGSNENSVASQIHYDAMTSPQAKRRWLQYVKNNSLFLGLYRDLRHGLFPPRAKRIVGGREPAQWVPAGPVPETPPDLPFTGPYRERVGHLIDRIRDFGARAIIVPQHGGDYRVADGQVLARAGADPETALAAHAQAAAGARAALAACAEKKAICIDLFSDLAHADGDFYDHVHTAPQGDRRIGAYLAEKLAPLLAAAPR